MSTDNKAKAAAGAGAGGAGADAKAAAGGAAGAAAAVAGGDADGNSASLHPFGGVNGAHLYNLQLELNRPASTEGKAAHAKLKQQGVHVVFVLDNSGSMGQDFTRTVIPLVNQSFERLKPNSVVPDIIIFDDQAHHITLQELQSKRACGGTEFGRALEKLQTVIKPSDNRTHQVIFLTDGQASFPTAQLKGFQSHIFGLRVGVHALGISAYDVNFLSKFVEIGTIAGTFQGSEKGTAFDLNGAAQKIIELVGGETGRSRAFIDLGATMALADPFKVAVANAAEAKAAAAAPGGPAGAAVAAADKMANHDAKKAEAAKGKDGKAAAADAFVRPGIPTEIVWKQDGPSFVSLWVVSSEEKRLTKADAVAVTVHLEEAAPMKLRATVVEDAGAGNDLFAGWLGERLAAISQTILSSEAPDVKQLKAIVDEVDKEAQKQTAQIWQIKDKEKRNAVFDRFKGVQELLKGCHEALAQIAVGKLDRDSKARLLNQAYQRRLEENSCANKKIAKLVTKRMADNAGQAESTATKIAELKASNSAAYGQLASSIVDSHPSLTTFFDYMRASNWVELLSEGEAIGVSLAMKARTVGIVAPAVIKIDRINTSCLSLDAYLDACRFQLVDKQNDPTKISSILPGMSRESINGAMGLYIHPLHWQSARLLLPQVLSQMTVGTPLAYASEMMKTLPFTALMRMVTDMFLAAELEEGAAAVQAGASGEGSGAAMALSDASLVLFWQLLRTCAHIAESYKLHDAKNNAFAPLITSDAPDLVKCAPLWGTDSLPATAILYGVRLAVQGAAVPDADDDKAAAPAAAAGAGAGAGAAAAPAGKAVAGTVIVNPWADAKAGDAKDAVAAGAPAFYTQALAEEVRRYCDWKFPNKAPDTVAAADKVLDALIDVAGEPKAAAPAAGAAAAAKSPLEQRALKAWMELTKGAADAKGDAKDAKAGGAAAAGAGAAAAAAEEKPFVFDPKAPSDSARKTAGEFEAGAWKQFEQLNAYAAFSALYAQLLAKNGGRAALLKSIDDNYGVAPEPLLRATKQAFTDRKAARAKAVAAGPGAAAVSANRDFLTAAGVSGAVFDNSLLRAVIISGIHHRSNPDRRDAIDRKAYVNPLVSAPEVTVAERKRQLTAKAAALGKAAHANAVSEAAHMFMSTTLECAAGILVTQFADRGHADFKELHDVLESREWVARAGADAVAKLFMVVDGRYKGFALQNGGKPWTVGKRTVHRIWTAYDPKLLPPEVLLKRFGHVIHCMDCWKRTPGHGAEHVHRGKNRKPQAAAKPDPKSKRSAKKAAKKK